MLNVFSSNQSFDSFSELYFVTHLMGSDLNNIIRTQRLTDDHVRFLTYQVSFSLLNTYIYSVFLDIASSEVYSFGGNYSS